MSEGFPRNPCGHNGTALSGAVWIGGVEVLPPTFTCLTCGTPLELPKNTQQAGQPAKAASRPKGDSAALGLEGEGGGTQ